MTQEQIVELLNRKIRVFTKMLEQNHKYNTKWRRDYYNGLIKGLKDAQSVIGILDR